MNNKYIFLLLSIISCQTKAQVFSGEYNAEWQWDCNKNNNFINQLQLELNIPVFRGRGTIQAATLHLAKTNGSVIDDWQGYSNIEADNMFASIAVLGYMHELKGAHFFIGVRNVNEDFFTSDVTSLFANSSCGIFPTIAASYPIANYPFSGLTAYFDVESSGWTFRNSLYNGAGYNGWKRHDNPFIVRPAKDGIFNISQLEYSCKDAKYFAGVAVSTRQYSIDTDGNMLSSDYAHSKTTCAWWVYGEQPVWRVGKKGISCMLQYSENTCRKNGCSRYGEIGGAYNDSLNNCGISAQYARFRQGEEYSVEVTWRYQLREHLSIQPSCQYISNKNGNFITLCTRIKYDF